MTARSLLPVLLVVAGAGVACNGGGAQVPADGAPGADAPAERTDTGTDAGAGMGGTGGGGAGGNTGVAGTGGAGTGGGNTGVAGTGGSNTGGAGTGGSMELQLPGCLRDLLATCPITGACSYQPSDAGMIPRLCYASGASSLTDGRPVCSTSNVGETTIVNKADGSMCYTLYHLGNPWQACESESYRWTDASGALVATATVRGSDPISGGIKVGCGGGTETSITKDFAPAAKLFGHGTCTPGACP